jgi:glycosyltransferase 2 family protein
VGSRAVAASPDTPAAGGRGVRIAGAVISVVSLVGVIVWAIRQPSPSLPSTPGELAFLALAIGLYGVATLGRAERWHALLEHNEVHASRADAYSLTAVGYMGNNVLPARGGDVVRVYLLSARTRAGIRAILGTLVAERLLDVLVLLVLFIGIASSRIGDAGKGAHPVLLLLAIAGPLTVLVVLVLALRNHRLVRRAIEFVRPILAATRNLASAHGLALLGGTVVIWCFEAATYYAVGRAASIPISPVEAVYVMTITGLFLVVPAGPGSAGTFDAGVLVGVRAVGAGGRGAVSFLLLLRFVLLVPVTIVGLVVLIVRYGGLSFLRARAEPRPT